MREFKRRLSCLGNFSMNKSFNLLPKNMKNPQVMPSSASFLLLLLSLFSFLLSFSYIQLKYKQLIFPSTKPDQCPQSSVRLDGWCQLGLGISASACSIESIHLHDFNLNGSIPCEIEDLTALNILSMESNKLTGSLPTKWTLGKH